MLLSEGENRCLRSVAGMTYLHSVRTRTPTRALQEVRFSCVSFLPFGLIPTLVLIAFFTLLYTCSLTSSKYHKCFPNYITFTVKRIKYCHRNAAKHKNPELTSILFFFFLNFNAG